MKKNNRAARAARFSVQCFDVVWQTTTLNFHICGFDDNSKSFTLCLYMKTIRAKQAKVHSTYCVERDQHGIIARDLT